MKNIIKNTKKGILAVVLFATALGYANESSFIIKNEAEKTSITLEHVKKGNTISIIDNNGIILYKELIEQTGLYSKGFDLTSLPDGYYFFEFDKDFEIKSIPFIVKTNTVVFKKEEETSVFKPTVRAKENLIFITKLSLNLEPLKIDLYYSNLDEYERINSEEIKGIQKIERIYKLDVKGKYKIVFKTEGRKFEEYVNI